MALAVIMIEVSSDVHMLLPVLVAIMTVSGRTKDGGDGLCMCRLAAPSAVSVVPSQFSMEVENGF